MLKNNNGFYKKRVIASFFIFVLFASFFTGAKKAEAQMFDAPAFTQRLIDNVIQVEGVVLETKKGIWEKIKEKMETAGASFYQKTLTFAVNTIAYDAANYIASAEKGQKPLFTTEYLKDLGAKAGDAAISEFITTLHKEWQVDLCHPNLDIKTKIGFGLMAQQQPTISNSCGWQELKAGWTSEYDRWKSIVEDKTYLDKVSQMFSPTGNDVAIALELFGRTEEVYKASKEKEEEQIRLNSGWLDVRDIGGRASTYSGEAKDKLKQAKDIQTQGIVQFTGETFVDAANIFINQLGIAGFNRLMSELGKLKNSPDPNPNDPTDDSDNYNADPRSYSGGKYLTQSLKKIIQPRFDVRADYNILRDLVTCSDADNPLPNNCVISDRFSQAVQNKNTVIEAINNGYLSADMVFSKEADYRTGLNERSLIILRKFRIIPLGWEEALARAEKTSQKTKNDYTLMDMISCFSPHDEFETFSQGFIRSGFTDYSWCEGLVDPSWVLKAPLNYCKKEGFGGYIMVKQVINIPDLNISDVVNPDDSSYTAPDLSSDISPIVISRADNYCADEQSCIKENSDGSCGYYGYCTEEKRTWNFNQDSCDPVFNTCESFTSNSNGKKLALLKNTIDYGSCNSDNIGCLQYSLGGSYNATSSKISWNNYPIVYFNNKVESCSSSNEGCNEYIRAIAGGGHNFLINGDFEKDLIEGDWDDLATSSIAYSGNLSVLLNNTLQKNVVVAPNNYTIAGESYTLSFYSFCSGNSTSTVSLGNKTQNIISSDSFAYQAITNVFPNNYIYNTVNFSINTNGNNCLIDNIKLEKGVTGTYYSNYRGNGLVYQKIIPEYLKTACYQNPYSSSPDYRLKSDAPNVCYNYARLCNNNEVGCNLFTSIYNIKTAAKVLDKDYCPQQCVGYDIYVQKETLFENKTIARFIPTSARTCGAADAGCTEFTNLDEVAAGGEGKEYYTYLRHCIKPTQGTCESFYSWQGSDESGYQLKSFSLEKNSTNLSPKVTEGSLSSVFTVVDPNSNDASLETTSDGSFVHSIGIEVVCSKEIYNLSPSDPLYNSDCREFYNQDGEKFYVLYSDTITCSDNCKTYRMTDKNINAGLNSSSCTGNTRHWNSEENVCYDCLAGGKWDNTQNACVYQAIPGEGQTCQASNNGCREYNGNAGNSVRNIASYDFNLGLNNWEGSVTSSLESLSQNGKSMKLTGAGEVNIGYSVKKGSSYIIKFLARSTQNKNLSISFSNGVESPALFGVSGLENQEQDYSINLPSSNDWKLYQVNLENLNHDISAEEILKFAFTESGGEIYIANINLLEINSRYYLIKNSWNTPEACYYDTTGAYQGVNYNLGCQSYTDRNSQNHNLRQFSSLCDSSAVGCEMVVDTHNSSAINSEIFNDHNNNGSCDAEEVDCLNVPADNFVAMVYDSNKSCNSENKGCSRLGKSISNNPYMVAQNLYSDVYVKNDPDKYNNILCQQDELGCDAWTSSYSGTAYFKDPGDNICLWRKGVDSSSNYAWYKKAVKKCKAGNTFTNNICNTSDDCSSGQACELDTADYLCPVESLKTIGLGGNSPIYQPSAEFGVGWAGACPIKQAGCTEYLDPSSSFSQNLVNNPNFADKDGDGQGFDDWTSDSVCAINNGSFNCVIPNNYFFVQYVQDKPLAVEPNKLYILKTNGPQEAILECDNPVYELQSDNKFSTGVNILKATSTNPKRIFYSGDNNNSCTIKYKKDTNLINVVPSLESLDLLQGYFNNSLSNSKFAFLNKLLKIDSVEAQGEDYSIEVKEVVMDYQLKQALDFSGCNGQADFNSGCVVFNERAVSANGQISSLNFNSSNYSNYSTCSGNNCDANSLIKVTADRTCGKWLSCYSWTTNPYTNEKICLEMGECSAFNYDGSCFNFIKPEGGTREYTPGRDNNATGYSVLGMQYLANMDQIGEDNSGISFDFELESDVSSFELVTPSNNISTSSCWINSPNSSNMGLKVSYPAHNLGFLKIGGSYCGQDDFVISKTKEVPVNSDNYLSFVINTEELSFSEKVEIKIIGVNGDNSLDWDVPTSTISQASGWQDISIKFTTGLEWTKGVRIALRSTNEGAFYIDNIRIEPVLEVKENEKYLQAICRLFPAQDSLTCETQNKNFVTNGWYGYCLQKDPKNSDVCLLWYPIDAVMGTKGSGQAQSAFPGYPDTGAKPYYCAEMSGNFDLVEYRDVYYKSNEKGKTNNTYANSNGLSFNKRIYAHIYALEDQEIYCDPNNKYYRLIYSSIDGDHSDCDDAFGDDAFNSEIPYNIPHSGLYRYSMAFFCAPVMGSDLIISTASDSVSAAESQGEYPALPGRVCCDNEHDVEPANCASDIPDQCNQLNCSNFATSVSGNNDNLILHHYIGAPVTSTLAISSTRAGWYKYDGSLSDGPESDKGLKLVAYDYEEDECTGDEKEWVDNIIGDDSTGCLMDLDQYVPKCTKIIQGETPWVKRVTNSNLSMLDYKNNDPDYEGNNVFQYYEKGLSGAPFGAIKLVGDELIDNTAYAGSPLSNNSGDKYKQYGFPYSCNSFGRTANIAGGPKNTCSILYLDEGENRIMVLGHDSEAPSNLTVQNFYDLSGVNYGVTSIGDDNWEWPNIIDYLKHIWVRLKDIVDNSQNYDFTENETNLPSGYDAINRDQDDRPSSTSFYARYPRIENITLTDSNGQPVDKEGDDWKVQNPGYYTLSFNTDVDAEQTPITKLIIRIKKEDSDWTNADGIISQSNIDNLPDINNPHRITKPLSSGDYKIMVKVIDNWGFYKCDGLNGFGSSDLCDGCCEGEFHESICSQCN